MARRLKSVDQTAMDEREIENAEVVRIGRFRAEKKAVASRSVSFETQPTSRVTIAPAKDDD